VTVVVWTEQALEDVAAIRASSLAIHRTTRI